MKKFHIPLRMCVGCGEMKPKSELLRIARMIDTDERASCFSQKISLDPTGKRQGRGAYLCKSASCLKSARKARRLEKTFSCKVSEDFYEKLQEEFGPNE